MNLLTCTLLLLFCSLTGNTRSASLFQSDDLYCRTGLQPDSLRDRQHLYNGVLWANSYRRITGDPYLFTNIFLPAELSFNGRKFTEVKLRYDIHNDHIMIPLNLDQIIIMNKEMVDSFSISYNNRVYNFINNHSDTLPAISGYLNILYKGRSALYVKYEKKINMEVTDYSDGEFYQRQRVLFVTDGRVHELSKLKDIFNIAGDKKKMIRSYMNENRIKVNRKQPDSFIPLVRFYDSLKM